MALKLHVIQYQTPLPAQANGGFLHSAFSLSGGEA